MKKIAIIGRPNVGKSTLFNRLIGHRAAVVEDEPGVTRDRHYGDFSYGNQHYKLIDTGGLFPDPSLPLISESKEQTDKAIQEADAIILLFDGRSGPHPGDQEIIETLRHYVKPVFYAVNKIEGTSPLQNFYEFYQLGIDPIFPISAEEGTGIDDLMESIGHLFTSEETISSPFPPIFSKVAVIGRPNVGKSTFINSLLKEERLITSPFPGTTRDSIDTVVQFQNDYYLFIDTAGIRRRGRISKGVERASVVRSHEAIKRSDMVMIIIDSSEGITEQDIKLVGLVIEEGKGFGLIINKWDLKKNEAKARVKFEDAISTHFSFIRDFPFLFLSAKEGFDPLIIFNTIKLVMESFQKRISTPDLNQFLEKTLKRFPPPLFRKKPVKILYATQAGVKPPTFVFFTNFKEGVTGSYIKFLENRLREIYGFKGSPIRMIIKQKKKYEKF